MESSLSAGVAPIELLLNRRCLLGLGTFDSTATTPPSVAVVVDVAAGRGVTDAAIYQQKQLDKLNEFAQSELINRKT